MIGVLCAIGTGILGGITIGLLILMTYGMIYTDVPFHETNGSYSFLVIITFCWILMIKLFFDYIRLIRLWKKT